MCERIDNSIGPLRGRERGYTMLEVTLVAVVAIIVLAISVPIAGTALENHRFGSAVQVAVSTIHTTRFQSIMRGHTMALEFEAGSNEMQVYEQPEGAEGFTAVGQPIPVGRVQFTEGGRLLFRPNGSVESTDGNFELNVEYGNHASRIEVSRFGSIRVQKPS